ANPDDAAANLSAGKFYCFTLEDFDEGLKHLAAGNDETLADAAKRDLAGQDGDAAKRFAAAVAWQQVAAKISDRDDKLAVQRREKWLLEHCVINLSGLDQTKANRRLDELKDIGQARATAAKGSASSRIPIKGRFVSMVGRLMNGDSDAGLL